MPEATTALPVSRVRLHSLDVLRGVTVAIMILVNTSGDGAHTFPILKHSVWNGCTLADLVFPCFLFMVGLSSVISLGGSLRTGTPRAQVLRRAAQRTVIILALGLLINAFPLFSWHTLRFFGVLQRIAVCYFAVTLLLLWIRTRTLVAITVALLVSYWILLRFVPVPGMGIPGSTVAFLDPYGNLPAWLDRHLLPAAHLYHQSFYDPEGLLSTLPSIASTLIGVSTGVWLRGSRSAAATLRGLLIAGLLCLAGGGLWSLWFPLNKRLWTSSFVLWTGGTSLLALALFFWLLDLRKVNPRWFYPATVFGRNALTAYVFSELLAAVLGGIRLSSGRTLQRWLFAPLAAAIPNPYMAALAYAVLFVAVCFVPVWLLYRRDLFVKI
jgi:predicted acyltransferase